VCTWLRERGCVYVRVLIGGRNKKKYSSDSGVTAADITTDVGDVEQQDSEPAVGLDDNDAGQ